MALSFIPAGNVGIGTNNPYFPSSSGQVKTANTGPTTFGPDYFNNNIIPGTGSGVVPAQPRPNPVSTGGGGSGNPSRDAFNAYRSSGGYAGWQEGPAWADWQATGGSKANQSSAQAAGPSAAEIYAGQTSDAYAPAISALDQWMSQLSGNKDQNLSNVGQTAAEGQQQISGQQQEGQQFQGGQQTALTNNLNSALADAVRYYNNLKQQSQALYGRGSSTGGAVNDLAQQAFLKNQGQLQNTAQQGFQAIQEQGTKLQNYIQDKTNQLGQWKRDAEQQIRDNFTNAINSINTQKGMIEANKTNAKLAALQQAQAEAQRISEADTSFKQQLGTWAVQQAQTAAQRSFTPQEIASIYNDMLGQNLSGFTGQTINQPSAVQQVRTPGLGAPSSTEDQLKQQGLTYGPAF